MFRVPIPAVFRDLSPGVRPIFLGQPFFSIPFGWIATYSALYMSSLGLTSVQIGSVVSITMAVQMVAALLGGHLADKFGRRTTLLVADCVAWILPCILWASASGYWHFVAAGMVSGLAPIAGVSWYCLIVEETPEHQRTSTFSVLQLVWLLPGFFSPIAGILIAQSGLTAAMRQIYWIAVISMTVMFFVRHRFLKESAVGEAMIRQNQAAKFKNTFSDYTRIVPKLLRDRRITLTLLISLALNFQAIIWINYHGLYLTQVIGFLPRFVSLVPVLSSVVVAAMILVVMPRWRRGSDRAKMLLGLVLLSLSGFTMLAAPQGAFLLIAVGVVLGAVGGTIFGPRRDAYWAGLVDAQQRGKITSVTNSLTMLFSLPVGPLAGYLFEVNPRFTFALAAIMFLGALGMWVGVIRWESEEEAASARDVFEDISPSHAVAEPHPAADLA